jgi:hypothetical protein
MRIKQVALALVMMTGLAPIAAADSITGSMMVSATVISRAVVSVDSQPSQVIVTADDVARGYVELPAPIVVHAKTNSRAGYLLQVNNVSDAFSVLELGFGNTTMRVAGESWVQRPYIAGGEALTLTGRLILAPGVTPGSHSLPIAISASAL